MVNNGRELSPMSSRVVNIDIGMDFKDGKHLLHVSCQEVWNIKPTPTNDVVKLRNVSDKLTVAAFLMTWVSSESLLNNSPVFVTSKNAISCIEKCTTYTMIHAHKSSLQKTVNSRPIYLVYKVAKKVLP